MPRAQPNETTQSVLPKQETVIGRAQVVAAMAFERASATDVDGGFPTQDIQDLRERGLLLAPFPADLGGEGLGEGRVGASNLFEVLRALGRGNLALGRLYEGHVNAALLLCRYGSPQQIRHLAQDVRRGALLGVWNAENPDRPVNLRPIGPLWKLHGTKVLASGAGYLSCPLVPALDEDGNPVMVLPRLDERARADLSQWMPSGMRASATGSFDLSGLAVAKDDIVGEPGDYLREPFFSGGAWRFLAVQLGAVEGLVDLFRAHLRDRKRDRDPFQRMRIAECTMASETARLWVERSALMLAGDGDAEAAVAYVDLARLVVERAALDVLDRVQRGVGLAAFIRPNPIERTSRDLRTYLCQPAPDAAMIGAAETILGREGSAAEIWRN